MNEVFRKVLIDGFSFLPVFYPAFSPFDTYYFYPLFFTMLTVILTLLSMTAAAAFLYVRHRKHSLTPPQDCYLGLFNDSPAALMVITPERRILEWNQAAETMFGFSESEARGKDIVSLIVPPSDRIHVVSILAKALREGSSNSKNSNITKSKEDLFCEWRNTRMTQNGTHKEGIICMAQDITASQKALDDLNKRSSALESAGEAIFYTNHKGLIEFANRSFFALFPLDKDAIIMRHIGEFLFGSISSLNAILPQFDANNTWKGTIIKACKEGDKVFSVVLTAIYNRNRLVSYIANLHDITEISSHVHALTHKAHHDPLTGAANRAAMDTRLIQAIGHARNHGSKIALFFIDLNDFKYVNDYYGHEAGDKLLAGVAQNLRACLRNSDTISRFGGDEFVVMIEEIKNQEHVETIFHTIQAAINEPIVIDSTTTLTAKASIGMAIYPEDATDPDELIKAADTSMYTAKKQKNGQKKSASIVPEPVLYADSHNH